MSAPEILYFGAIRVAGHYLHSKRDPHIDYDSTPWRYDLDQGIVEDPDQIDGKLYLKKKDGWTALGFWDRSVDSRPGSNSVFLVAKDWTAEQILKEAELQWPEVCGRKGFPIRKCNVIETEE